MLSSLISCSVKGTNWDIDVNAPVVETKLDLSNLVGDNNMVVDSDSSVYISINDSLYTFSFDTLSSLPLDKNVYAFIWTAPNLTLPGGTSLPGIPSTLDINNTGAKLSRFDVKQGKLRCTLKSTLSQRLIMRYYIPKATKNGVMLEFIDTLPGVTTPGDTVVLIRDFTIDDYTIDLTGDNGDDFNSLTAYKDVRTIVGDPGVLVTTGQTLFKTETELIEMTPNYAKGYLGEYSFNNNISQSNFNGLQIIRSGLIDVENIDLKLTFHNTIGADISFQPIEIKATNTRTGQIVILSHSTIGTTININRAIENTSITNPLTPSSYTFSINSGNSNIESFLELIPDQLSLLSNLHLNPYGNTSGYTDFFYYNYPAYISMQLNMPLKFSAANLLLVDTIDNPFVNLEILDPISDGEFIVRVENKFPLESNLQLYTMDGAGLITDSVFANNVIAAPPVNAINRVEQALTTDLIIQITAAKIQQLKSATKLKLIATFNTQPSASGKLQFYSDYYMIIRMIADVKYNIEL